MRLAYLLLTVNCLLLSLSVSAQEIPVDIKADKLKYFESTGQIEASGSVEVQFKTTKILADRLLMNSATKIATAEGNVRIFSRDYQASSNFLVYDADRDLPFFSNFSSQISLSKMRGPLYLSARHLRDLHQKLSGEAGSVTTCGEKMPHYFLFADKIAYYPNDLIEGWNVTLYVGELPVFWMPYLRYSLKEEGKRNWAFGHNEIEGDYLKTFWSYALGIFFLDFMDKKGWGYGTQLGYGLGMFGLGTLYLYHQPEKNTGIANWVTKIDHEKELSPWTKLKLNHRYTSTYQIPSGRIEQTAFGLNLNYSKETLANLRMDALDDRSSQYSRYVLQFDQSAGRESLNYYYSYDFARSDPKWMRKSQRLSFRRPLFSDRVFFSTTTNYYHSTRGEGDLGEEKIEPQIELTGSESFYSWRYTENWFIDLRQNLSPGVPRYEFLERQPEIEIYPRSLDLGLFNLQSTFGFGRYREVKQVPALGRKRDFTTERYRASLNAGKSVALGVGTVLALGAGLDQYLYAPGDQLYAFRENASLTTNLYSCFRNEINFRQGYTDGNTPFFFDQLGTRYHDIREKMTFYYLDKFSWSIEGGHNWQTKKYYDVMTHLLLSPDKRVRWTVDTGWDIENTRYKDLVTSLQFAPYSFFTLSLSAVQDMNGVGLRSGSVLYDVYFLEQEPNQVHLRVGQVFDPTTKEFKVRDIMMVKDLHCWEMKFSYSDYRKEISFVFSLKAMPEEPVGFASGRGFYYDGFERELKKFKPEGEIRRY